MDGNFFILHTLFIPLRASFMASTYASLFLKLIFIELFIW